MKSYKVIIDTNLWISFLITNDYSSIDKLVDNRSIVLIFSEELIEEFLTVTQRPKFLKYFSEEDINQLLKQFDKFGKLVKIKSKVEVCRDTKDNFLLNLAIDSKAHFLVTGDADLLDIAKIEKTKIITFRQLIEKFNIA